MKITGIAHIALNVLDMDQMLDFYVDTLGMKKAFELPHTEEGRPPIVYVKVAPMVFLEFFHGGVKDRDINCGPEQIGTHHWCITCTNMYALRERLLAKGYVKPDMIPIPREEGGWNWWIDDPDGNVLEINQMEDEEGADEITGIQHIGIVVSDIEKTREFYRDRLGFKETKTLEQDGKPWITFMEIAPGQAWEFFWGGTKTRRNTWHSYGLTHICLQCDNVAALVKSLRAKGWNILLNTKTGLDKNTQAWVEDPDGTRIELMQIHPDSPQAKA